MRMENVLDTGQGCPALLSIILCFFISICLGPSIADPKSDVHGMKCPFVECSNPPAHCLTRDFKTH